jgi:phosphate transport system permease protein
MQDRVEKISEKLFTFAAIFSAAATAAIFGFLIVLGLPLLWEGRLFYLLMQMWAPRDGLYGIYPMLLGTFFISSLGVAFAIPFSLGAASLIGVFAPGGFGRFLRKVMQMAVGIPTVIYGFVGVFLLVPFIREFFKSGSGFCALSAALMLAVLVTPTMVLFFIDGFERIPKSYLNAVDALGGSEVQKLMYVILPYSWRHIVGGIVLSIGRAIGDTLLALMLSGNAAQIPNTLLESARTLTAHIALVIASDYESPEFHSIFACGLALYIFSTVVILLIRLFDVTAKEENK